MFMDMRNFKFMCLQAYCLRELEEAKEAEIQMECLDEKDRKPSDDVLFEICDRIKKAGNTVDNIKQLSLRFSPLASYYNLINKTVERHFHAGDHYIPAFLILSILQEYTLRGHKLFEDIEFTKVIDFYFKKENNPKKHLKCAMDVVDSIEKIKAIKKVKKQSKRKR